VPLLVREGSLVVETIDQLRSALPFVLQGVRRLVGYRSLEGPAATAILGRLYTASRLFVNFFQPSFKLKEKLRIGGRTGTLYDPPQAGQVRPTHLNRKHSPHDWRTRPDPFETTWPTIFAWFEDRPELTTKTLFRRLQSERPVQSVEIRQRRSGEPRWHGANRTRNAQLLCAAP
jgi:hypothetical protein